jgi:hypothetical protein
VDEVLKKIEAFKPKLEGLAASGAALKERMDTDVAKMTERREWITRKPASGEMDLLAAAAKSGWHVFGPAEFTLEGGVLTIKGTGEQGKVGIVYASHAWWRDFDADLEVTIASGGFQLVAHVLPPKSGYPQPVLGASLGIDKPIHLTLKVTGEDIVIGGDVADTPSTSKSMPPAGGIGFYIGHGSVVKLTSLKLTPR